MAMEVGMRVEMEMGMGIVMDMLDIEVGIEGSISLIQVHSVKTRTALSRVQFSGEMA